ncbi:MAG: hypothetical protein E7665_01015 [Ruminococcaceae bacterium]|nr:hypothetical protein [Oscillospiraceae bacterium]
MKLIFKFKRLISIAVLAVMMSTMLIVPASACGSETCMGFVTFTRGNITYAEGHIGSSGDRYQSLSGSLELTDVSDRKDLQMWLYVGARNMESLQYSEFPVYFYGNDVNSIYGTNHIDSSIYLSSAASADFYVGNDAIFYVYQGGWNGAGNR